MCTITWLLLLGCVPELASKSDPAADDGACDWQAPQNRWTSYTPPCLEAEGFEVGEVAPDIRLPDQHGDEVSLWQFYGDLIVLDFSAEWCKPCYGLAQGVDEILDEYGHDGVQVVTLLYDGQEAPTAEWLEDWADLADDVAPVLGDDGTYTDQVIGPNDPRPRLMLIDREMRVQISNINPPEDGGITSALDANL